jgi:peptidoglycan/LPS O-acetylase OafA/YrhL
MGILRFYLALSVCLNHLVNVTGARESLAFIPDSFLAVEVFFAISGFYMAFILGGKYAGPGGLAKFYGNRALRIFPVYLAIVLGFAALSLAVYLAKGHWVFLSQAVDMFLASGPGMQAYAVVSNLTMVGQDLMFLMRYDPAAGTACLGCPPADGLVVPWQMLVIPQAWSVEVELMFYALAPWLIRLRTKTVLPAIAAILVLKLAVASQVTATDYWIFRFPGFELAMFLTGILACRFYRRIERMELKASTMAWATGAMFALLMSINLIDSEVLKTALVYLSVPLCLPLMFKAFRNSALDRAVGELSYPMYLVHYLVMQMVIYWYRGPYPVAFAVCMVIAGSYLLCRFVSAPLDAYRQSRVRATPAPATRAASMDGLAA